MTSEPTTERRAPRRPLPSEVVQGIRIAKEEGSTQKEIAETFGVSESCVSRIIRGSRHRGQREA